MSYDDVITVPRDRDSDDDMSRALVEIDGEISAIEAELETLMPLIQRRHQLLTARAAMLGEPAPTLISRSARVTRAHVERVLAERPGSRAGEIAAALGVGQPAISAHLYRGKREIFACRGGRWYLRRE
jgi:DNA-binding transcriptional ArsR family regulator